MVYKKLLNTHHQSLKRLDIHSVYDVQFYINVQFFLQKDYSSDINKNNNAKQNEEIIKMIENIRQPIANTDEVNKHHSLKYLQNLNKLSVAYNNL